ncbi:MAG: VanZ family protein [Verrucomicrobiota bacterium]
MLTRFNFWIPPVAWALVIFALSAMPPRDKPGFYFPGFDKIAHLGVYGILGFLVFMAFIRETRKTPGAAFVLSILIASLYGLSDEWHQSFVPGREVEAMDWVADTFGGAFGALAARLYHHRTLTPDRKPS